MTGIEESELKARELRLREEQLRLDQEKFQASRRNSALDWVRGLGLPIASLIASLFFFAVQQQQQAFERAVGNVRDGLRLYYDRLVEIEGVKALDTPEKIADARDVLQSTIRIYPEVFCSARSDLLQRIEATPMTEETRQQFQATILSVKPEADRGLATPRWSVVSRVFEPSMAPCETKSTAPAPTTTEDELAAEAPAAPAPTAEAPAADAAAPPAPATKSVAEDINSADRSIAVRSLPPPTLAAPPLVASTGPVLAPAKRVYRVFAQIGPTTSPDLVASLREEAAPAGYGIVRGVERMRSPIATASVRYNGQGIEGAAVAADAAELARWLEAKLGRPVEAVDIGKRYATMRPDTLEIWLPDGAAERAPPRAPRPLTPPPPP